ncbi:hypothetical protein BDV96DRAFT_57002 [Lophiotrema nucula]|uniref:Uncharacterized protein n=1 Tax=Lophiotrema nucula TaxID=690887 RepID=A0A6A5ZBP4_9PLEO|nr:hypothetical protein BDV96DRAFT_57002 [Lophiotrema nucula]
MVALDFPRFLELPRELRGYVTHGIDAVSRLRSKKTCLNNLFSMLIPYSGAPRAVVEWVWLGSHIGGAFGARARRSVEVWELLGSCMFNGHSFYFVVVSVICLLENLYCTTFQIDCISSHIRFWHTMFHLFTQISLCEFKLRRFCTPWAI